MNPADIKMALRYDADGQPLWGDPIHVDDVCALLAPIWTKRLQRGEYTRIELTLRNGQRVTVKRLQRGLAHVLAGMELVDA